MLAMARAFPGAPIYTTLYDPEETYPEFRDLNIIVSPLNKVGGLRRNHRLALPLLARAAERMVIEEDIVVASSSGWAHGFDARGAKVVYCHSPARWLYLTDEYVGEGFTGLVKGLITRALKGPLIRWDRRAAKTADRYLANSTVVQQRITDVYDIAADVLPPPHGLTDSGAMEPISELADWQPGHYLVVSRLMPYKNVDKVAAAFAQLPDERLLVIGDGPLREALANTSPVNVRFLQNLSDQQMRWAYANARALLAPSYEDFGLTPLEAGAFGKPVVALRAGGYLDTVLEGTTGVFFERSEPDLIADAVRTAQARDWDQDAIRDHAARFAEPRFHEELREAVAEVLPEDMRVSFRNRWQHGGPGDGPTAGGSVSEQDRGHQ